MKSKSLSGTICAALANFIFGFSFLFSKTALDVAHPLIILAVRFTVAFVFMALLALTGAVKINFKGKNLKGLLLMSLAQPLVYFIAEIYGIKYTATALSGIVIALVPAVAIILGAVFLKEIPTKAQIFFCALSLAGVIAITLLSKSVGKNYIKGVLLLILAVICAAVFNLLSRKESSNFSAAERTVFMFFVSAVGFNLIALIALKGEYVSGIAAALTHSSFMFSILYLGIVSSCLAFLLYNFATAHISLARATAFANLVTVVSLLAGILILRESFTPLQIALCAVVLAGVFGVNVYGK